MQKTSTLLALFSILTVCTNAQIKKGSSLVGFDIGLSGSNFTQSYNGNDVKSSSTGLTVALLYGKAIKENLLVGGGLSYQLSTLKQGNPQVKQTVKNYGASAWTRKYYPVYGPVYAFVNGSLSATIGQTDNPLNNPVKTNSFGINLGVYPGIGLQVKKNFYFDIALNNLASIYYNRTSGEQKDNAGNIAKQSTNSYGFSTSLGNNSNPLQLGIRWIIPGKG